MKIMKMLLFVSAMFFATVSFADQRVFDCTATQLSNHPDLSYAEDLNIEKNPHVLFIEGKKDWTLNVGDITLSTSDLNGPDLEKEVSTHSDSTVRYDFWVERSYEFELVINVEDYSADVYWWGLGQRTPVGRFQCEVSEK
jgi:hypothetical protein